MRLPEHRLRNWVAAASTPQERRASCYRFYEAHPQAEELLQKWLHALAGGNREVFEKALAAQGISPSHALLLLGKCELLPSAEIPVWARTLKEILEACDFQNAHLELSRIPNSDHLPFFELWYPVVAAAGSRLRARCAGNAYMQAHILEALQFDILSLLGSISARTLYSEFSSFRAARRPGASGSPFSHVLRDEFLALLREDGLQTLFSEAPVLARFTGNILHQWEENSAEFLNRLQEDAEEIAEHCGRNILPEQITLRTGISDRHRGGKRCILLTLDASCSFLYKPRSLLPEKFFRELYVSLGPEELAPSLMPWQILRDEHGWEQAVTEKACEGEQEVKKYFQRSGALLAVTTLLGGLDFHGENLIACGAHPVLIDLEGIASHFLFENAAFERLALTRATQSSVQDSVLRSSLLPLRMQMGEEYVDVAGLPATYCHEFSEPRTRWKHADSDALRPEQCMVKVGSPRNRVFLGTRLVDPRAYRSDLKEGYRLQYEKLLQPQTQARCKTFFLAQEKFLSRFIYRDTAFYAHLTETLLSAVVMRSGNELGIALEGLGRAQALGFETPGGSEWNIVESEKRQFLELDVPQFFTESSGRDLLDAQGICMQDCFAMSAREQCIKRLSELSLDGMKRELAIIEQSYAGGAQDRISTSTTHQTSSSPQPRQPSQPGFQEAANTIAEMMLRASLPTPDGSRVWLGSIRQGHGESLPIQLSIQPLSLGLYEGVLGPALFLAAFSKISGDKESARLAKQLLLTSFHTIENPLCLNNLIHEGVGAFQGFGALLYALHTGAQILQSEELLYAASHTLSLLDLSRIQAVHKYDVLEGISGLSLVILLLAQEKSYSEKNNAQIERVLEICAKRLLEISCAEDETEANANTLHFTGYLTGYLTGFAHGSSGVALACSKLADFLQNTALTEQARGIRQWEDVLYDEEQRNWKSHAFGDAKYLSRWCHGKPGILFSRFLEKPSQEIQKYESLLVAESDCQALSLCCGNPGLADMTLYIAQQSGDHAFRESSRALLTQSLSTLLASCPEQGFLDVGFFQGISGIGYAALRHIDEALPCVIGVR